MTSISDEYMRTMIPLAREYCVVILKAGPKRNDPGIEAITWEHARRNFSLRQEGILSIICRIDDGSPIKGIGIFHTDIGHVKGVMDDDPGVRAGIFEYEVHSCHGFPGDCLPS
jgi:hypothetical protein